MGSCLRIPTTHINNQQGPMSSHNTNETFTIIIFVVLRFQHARFSSSDHHHHPPPEGPVRAVCLLTAMYMCMGWRRWCGWWTFTVAHFIMFYLLLVAEHNNNNNTPNDYCSPAISSKRRWRRGRGRTTAVHDKLM